jgi:hypothetical protein
VKFRGVAKEAGLRAAWSNPILSHDGKVLGTLGMYYRESVVLDQTRFT